jgi:isoquinoline 1-oxidoreductase beta subunit
MIQTSIDRRRFLQFSGATGTVLALAFSAEGLIVNADAAEAPRDFVPNGYLQISASGIVLFAPNPEIGQGVKTALPMIVAEELDADWEDIEVRQAVIDAARYGSQAAGGSTSVPRAWEPLRRAGASARAMLISAAASRWQVPVSECVTRGDSAVHHSATQRRLTYRELAADAAALPVPALDQLVLKSASERRLLKRRIGGVDNRGVVTGQKLFASDVYLPGMAYALYVKCPAVGGSAASANLEELKREPGVIDAFILEGNGDVVELQPGVAIVATSTWAALKARRKLKVEWNEASAAKDDWAATSAQSLKLADSEGAEIVAERGEIANTFTEAAHQLNSVYQYAFVSHAQLEPQVCVARMTAEGGCELWPPSQTPQRAQKNVANVLKIDEGKVTIHPVRVGGGFGRRLMNDYACEAAAIAQRLGRPVKLQWMREDDMTHDFVRAGGTIGLRGAIDNQGRASAWQQHFVTFTRDGQKPVLGGDLRAQEDFSQLIPHFRYTRTQLPWGSPTGFWRAPGASVFAFPLQSFLHELSVAAGRDHLDSG